MEAEGGKMAKKKTWNFSPSQIQLLQEQARIHNGELQPLLVYQTHAQSNLLNSFREELGISDEILLTAEVDKLRFVLRVPEVKK